MSDFRKGRSGRLPKGDREPLHEIEAREILQAVSDLITIEHELRGAGDPVYAANQLRRVIRFLRGESEP